MDKKSSQIGLKLNGSVVLNDNSFNITEWNNFEKINGTFIQDKLIPWKRDSLSENAIYIYNGKEVSVYEDKIFFDNREIGDLENKHFEVENVSSIKVNDRITAIVIQNSVAFEDSETGSLGFASIEGLVSFSAVLINDVLYATVYNNANLFKTSKFDIRTHSTNADNSHIVVNGALLDYNSSEMSGSFMQKNCYNIRRDISNNHKFWYNSNGVKTRSLDFRCANGILVSGRKIPLGNNWFILENLNMPTGISYDGNIIVSDISDIVYTSDSGVYFLNTKGELMYVSIKEGITFSIFQERFLCFNTTSYLNTFDCKTGKLISRSDDYNNRLVITGGTGDWSAVSTAWNEQVLNRHYINSSMILAPYNITVTYNSSMTVSNYLPQSDFIEKHSVNFYSGSVQGALTYRTSYAAPDTMAKSGDSSLTDVNYPSEVLTTVSVISNITDTLLNIGIASESSESNLLENDFSNNVTFTLKATGATQIPFKTLFTIGNTMYGISENNIMTVTLTPSVSTRICTNIYNLQFIGATKDKALFFSWFDRCLYAFTGAQNLVKITDAQKINFIYSFIYEISANIVAISTDIGTLILYNDQLSIIDDIPNMRLSISASDTIVAGRFLYTLFGQGERQRLKLKTPFYGNGNESKSIVNAILIRITDKEKKTGKFRARLNTLNDKVVECDWKEFNVDKNVFDDYGQALIKYQPRHQEAVATQLEIESDYDINSVTYMISQIPNATNNTKLSL